MLQIVTSFLIIFLDHFIIDGEKQVTINFEFGFDVPIVSAQQKAYNNISFVTTSDLNSNLLRKLNHRLILCKNHNIIEQTKEIAKNIPIQGINQIKRVPIWNTPIQRGNLYWKLKKVDQIIVNLVEISKELNDRLQSNLKNKR